MQTVRVESFAHWRDTARQAASAAIPPSGVRFEYGTDQQLLFGGSQPLPQEANGESAPLRIPKAFLKLCERVALHSSPRRYDLLYRMLWRLSHGEPRLLEDAVDPDVATAERMQKAVSRDAHKAKAFVRFHQPPDRDAAPVDYVAWHRADHHILTLVAPFFSRRFPASRWLISTPFESVSWDLTNLHYGPGLPRQALPNEGDLVGLWKTYYAAAFNPARKKEKAMLREMPRRYWSTMPETQLLPEMLASADRRAAELAQRAASTQATALPYLPADRGVASLREAAAACRGCDLCEPATQTVFGDGPQHARLMLVGEQPGDEEDRAGEPFVGPAGRVLGESLAAAGVDRGEVYLTNTVKHFRFVQRGKRRVHQKPLIRHVNACSPWIEAEIDAVRPQAIVCLGATAAQALIRRDFKLRDHRGRVSVHGSSAQILGTYHPSAVLRARTPEERDQYFRAIVEDLRQAAALLR